MRGEGNGRRKQEDRVRTERDDTVWRHEDGDRDDDENRERTREHLFAN